MSADMRAVNLAVDEAQGLLDRHPEVKDHPLAGVSALAFGMLRAIAECPRCPGHFRTPTTEPPDGWYCHCCGGRWLPSPAAPAKARTPRRTH